MIQTDLPLDVRPFAVLARRLNTDEDTVLERLRWLKEEGFIRRIGPFFDSGKLGYISTLLALRVCPEQIAKVAKAINAYPGVTHNYEREGGFNLWVALLSPNRQQQDIIFEEIKKLAGVEKLVSLPATRRFKVNVQFLL